MRKWYVQTERYCNIFDVTEDAAKTWLIQDELLKEATKELLTAHIKVAPAYSNELSNVWFTDASSKREGMVTFDRKHLERKVWTCGEIAYELIN